jgi:hypothetical protein
MRGPNPTMGSRYFKTRVSLIIERISLIFSASIVFGFLFVKDGNVESFVCENEIDDAEVLRDITIKRTIAVFKVLIDNFFIISSYIIGAINII